MSAFEDVMETGHKRERRDDAEREIRAIPFEP
jgi:hypothetical protein